MTALTLTLLIGFSHIFLGVHYLTDVLGSWAAGIVWLTVCVTALESVNLARTHQVEEHSEAQGMYEHIFRAWRMAGSSRPRRRTILRSLGLGLLSLIFLRYPLGGTGKYSYIFHPSNTPFTGRIAFLSEITPLSH